MRGPLGQSYCSKEGRKFLALWRWRPESACLPKSTPQTYLLPSFRGLLRLSFGRHNIRLYKNSVPQRCRHSMQTFNNTHASDKPGEVGADVVWGILGAPPAAARLIVRSRWQCADSAEANSVKNAKLRASVLRKPVVATCKGPPWKARGGLISAGCKKVIECAGPLALRPKAVTCGS